ncbi:MAG: phosphopentomutase, partial [Thermoanaerobaculia bacterium]
MPFNFQIFIFLLDGLGVGAQEDSLKFGDEGANTLGNLLKNTKIEFSNLKNFGLFYFIDNKSTGISSGGKLFQVSKGKDTSSGHWELMGVPLNFSFPTYPEGFPEEIIREFERRTGRKVIGNRPASGTEIIKELGEEHIKTGALIVYTSADSVFQIAACEDIIPVDELYQYCKIAREILKEPHNVLRVIARPFKVIDGNYVRTERRKDFSLKPPKKTFLSLLQEKGGKVLGIGKIKDIFASEGIDENWHYKNMEEGLNLFKK